MNYMAKIDRKDFEKWKENNGEFNGRLMFQIWVNELADKKKFDRFLKSVTEKQKERTKQEIKHYKLMDLDAKNWQSFLKNCRENSMYGNDMVNILIKKFNQDGYCLEAKMRV